MQELSLLEKYDAVLDVLYDISGKSPTFDRIQASLVKNEKKVDGGELWDILNTMIKDNFVYFVKNNQTEEELYLLSFNGKLLKETGGLEKKLNTEKKKDQLNIDLNEFNLKTGRWTRINIVITSIIGSITLIAVLTNLEITINKESKELSRHLKDSLQQTKTQENASELNKNLLQIRQTLQDTAKVKVRIEK